MTDWIKERLVERTSLDGAMLIAVGVIVLLLGPLAKWAAYAAHLAKGPSKSTMTPTAISIAPSSEVLSTNLSFIQSVIVFPPFSPYHRNVFDDGIARISQLQSGYQLSQHFQLM